MRLAERTDDGRPTTAGSRSAVVHALPPLAVAAGAILAVVPLFEGRLIGGHDALEHAMRTAEYARAVRSGIWWPQWAPSLGRGYGEPIFLFNPPLFYALATLPTLLGAPVVTAMNLATAILVVAAGLGVYVWTAPTFGRLGGLVAGTAYAWSPYLLLDLYARQSLTELTAICVLPWALAGLAQTCRASGRRHVAMAATGVGMLLLASTPAALVAAPALLGQAVALARRHRPDGLARGVVSLALGGLLAAAFWVPAMWERHLLRFERLLVGPPAFSNHFLEPWQLVSTAWGYGASEAGPNDRLGFGLGTVHLALALVGLGLLVAGPVGGVLARQARLAAGLACLGIFMTLQLSEVIWESVTPLQYLQFPWRFLILPTIGCASLAALPVALLGRFHARAATVAAVMCAVALVATGWTRAQPNALVAVPPTDLEPSGIVSSDRGRSTAREYETIWTEGRPDEPAAERLVVRSGSATVSALESTAAEERFAVSARGRARLRLNTFYFPGWRIYVDGHEEPIDWTNPSGLVEFSIERGDHTVLARFESTAARLIGRALSLAALGILVVLVFWPTRRRRHL